MKYFSEAQIQVFWKQKWQEAIGESYSLSIGNTTASATLVGYIDSDDLALAIASILGYSVCLQKDNIRMIFRLSPVCHPRIRNLYASSVRITPYAFMDAPMGEVRLPNSNQGGSGGQGNQGGSNSSGGSGGSSGAGKVKSGKDPGKPYKEESPSYKSQLKDPFALGESYNKIFFTTKYKKLKLEIDFSEFVGVVFASNTQPDFRPEFFDKEFKRYTQSTFDYNLEILQMDNAASLVFDAGPAKEQAFPTPVGIMLPQAKLKLRWMWVPHDFISDKPLEYGKTLYNETIQSMLGHVNSKEFLGFKPGTLLFSAWKTEPIVIPVADAETNAVVMKLAWNIEFEFSYLNVEAADTYRGAKEWAIRGHNTFPYRGDGKFYPASIREERTSPIPGNLLYKPANFARIFRTIRVDGDNNNNQG
jgi:hypothetical protein